MTARSQVPDEGELQLGTMRLPAGRLLRSEDGDGEPVAWRTQAPVPEPGPVWSALSALHGQTGLVPVLEPVGWAILKPRAGRSPQLQTWTGSTLRRCWSIGGLTVFPSRGRWARSGMRTGGW